MKPIKQLQLGKLKVVVSNKLGVDNIKAAFTEIIETTGIVVDLTKKFNPRDLVELGFKLADYQSKVAIFKMALEEFRDGITPNEAQEISDHFKLDFDIANDQLELIIERGIDMLPRTLEHVKASVELYIDWKDYAQDLRPFIGKKKVA